MTFCRIHNKTSAGSGRVPSPYIRVRSCSWFAVIQSGVLDDVLYNPDSNCCLETEPTAYEAVVMGFLLQQFDDEPNRLKDQGRSLKHEALVLSFFGRVLLLPRISHDRSPRARVGGPRMRTSTLAPLPIRSPGICCYYLNRITYTILIMV